jgi:putative transposase
MTDRKKSRFSEEQIIGFIKQAEAGIPIKEVCRKGGFSDATFYKWRAKFGGMEVPDARKPRELEGENAKLKKLLAEAHLDMHALKSVLGVKRLPHRSSAKRLDAWWLTTTCPNAERAALWGSPATATAMRPGPTRPRSS